MYTIIIQESIIDLGKLINTTRYLTAKISNIGTKTVRTQNPKYSTCQNNNHCIQKCPNLSSKLAI